MIFTGRCEPPVISRVNPHRIPPMNTSQKLRALLLASMLGGSVVQAADTQPAPDMAALMALLNSLAAQSAEGAPEAAPATEPAPLPAAPAPAQRPPAAPAPAPSPLRTGSLSTSSLTASGPLSGHGAGPAVRLTEADWRVLFQAKAARN